MKLVEMTGNFVSLKIGDQIEVEEHEQNEKAYVTVNEAGHQVFVPKVLTKDVTPEEKKVERVKKFDSSTAIQPSDTNGLGLSPEELAVISAMSGEGSLEASENDGPVSSTSFTPAKGITLEEKERLLKDKATKEGRAKLNFTGTPLLKEGQFWLTDLTDGKLPVSGVNHIITVHTMMVWTQVNDGGKMKWSLLPNTKNPWFNNMCLTDIPDIDWEYYWNPDVLESLIIGYKLNDSVLLTGPPGTGKTSAVKQYAAWTDHPYMRFNGKDGIEQGSFLGCMTAFNGNTEWKDGILPQGLKQSYIICLDEVFKIPPGIQMALQALYERGGFLMLDDKPGDMYDKIVWPAEHARLFLTDNVKGTGDAVEFFAASQAQDTSTVDRFGITQNVPYLPHNDEVIMLSKKYPSVGSEILNNLVKFANKVRDGYLSGKIALTLSPRGLFVTLDQVTKMGIGVQHALQYAFINKIADDVEKQIISQFCKAIWR